MAYTFGQAVRLSTGTITGDTGAVDPATLVLTITLPDTTIQTVNIGSFTRDSVGVYHYDYLPPQPGDYLWRIVATVPNAASEGAFSVAAAGQFEEPQRDWTPSTADIAGLLPQRTIDATGIPTGSFSASTEPTDSQVANLISMAAAGVAAATGPIPAQLAGDARMVAMLGTAVLVEESFDGGSQNLAGTFQTQYELGLGRLAKACAEVNQSGQVIPDGQPPAPLFNFPQIDEWPTYGWPWNATTADTRW